MRKGGEVDREEMKREMKRRTKEFALHYSPGSSATERADG